MDKMLKRVTQKKQKEKRYSADDNFYTCNRNEQHNGYYTISNRSNSQFRSRSHKGDDVIFKRFLKVFNTSSDKSASKDWFLSANNVRDLAPRILTKRFCGKKAAGDNELYRSNSFKFERFERDTDTLGSNRSPVSRQISLCDDYSLPVDFVNKRPLSLDSGSFWSAPSPNGDQIEVLNLYCDPKDSEGRERIEESASNSLKLYEPAAKDYTKPYTDTSDDEREDDDAELYENLKNRKSLSCRAAKKKSEGGSGKTYTEVRESPYYYADLLKKGTSQRSECERKCRSLDAKCASSEPEDDAEMATRRRPMYETAFDSKIRREPLDELTFVANSVERCSPQTPYDPDQQKERESRYDPESLDAVRRRLASFELRSVTPRTYSSASTVIPRSVSSTLDGLDSASDGTRECCRARVHRRAPPVVERRKGRFSSTESMTTSSSGGSLESIRSSTSEGNRSTTSTDSHHSSSLSSHSSDSAMGGVHRYIATQSNGRFVSPKLHILSPISDKSFQEFGSDEKSVQPKSPVSSPKASSVKKRLVPNRILAEVEQQPGSDSGISMESRSDKPNVDLNDLPFDMPKLRRRRMQQMQLTQSTQDTSSSATSVDLKDLPFDMPKLRRKLKSSTQESAEADAENGEQTGDEGASKRSSLILNFDQGRNRKSLGLILNLNENNTGAAQVDTSIPLERQTWFHGAITRMEAENELRNLEEGSYLVRNSESSRNDHSLSLKSAKGFMHIRIQKTDDNKYAMGQLGKRFDSIPHLVEYYVCNQLPIRGAEHMCLLHPVVAQLL